LLCTNVDPNVIQSLGQWKSGTTFWYLFMQACPLVNYFAQCMDDDGNFDLLPDTLAFHIFPNPPSLLGLWDL